MRGNYHKGSVIMKIDLSLGAFINYAIAGFVGSAFTKESIKKVLDNLNKNKRLANHDLKNAATRSYYLALKSICEECIKEGNNSKNEIRWLKSRIEDFQNTMRIMQKDEYSYSPIEHTNQMELLISTEQSLTNVIEKEKKKMVTYAITNESPPLYVELVNKTLFHRVCGFFAFEIKNNDVVNRTFQSQVLSNIDIKVNQISDYLMKGVEKYLPALEGTLNNIEQVMHETNKTFEDTYNLLINKTISIEEQLHLLNEKVSGNIAEDVYLRSISNYNNGTLKGRFSTEIDIDILVSCDKGSVIDNLSQETLIISTGRGMEGGTGKTTILRYIWKTYLDKYNEDKFTKVPIYISLSGYRSNGEEASTYIKNRLQDYGIERISLYKFPLILLLDGLDEVNCNKDRLIAEIDYISTIAPKVQIVITSRITSSIINDSILKRYNVLKLSPLSRKQIKAYLSKNNVSASESLFDLLENPMLLTMYIGLDLSSNEKVEFMFKNEEIKFIPKTGGMLLYAYIERHFNKMANEMYYVESGDEYKYYENVVYEFLPTLAYHFMVRRMNFITELDLGEFFDKWKRENCIINKVNNKITVEQILVNDFPLLKKENQYDYTLTRRRTKSVYSFIHTSIKEFFASFHISNFPEEMERSPIPPAIRNFLGEILMEDECKPICNHETRAWESKVDSKLVNLLNEKYRGGEGIKVQTAVSNIIEIMKYSRENDLSGCDLSQLDLRLTNLNGVVLSRFYKDKLLTTDFSGSIIDRHNILSEGHASSVRAITEVKGDRMLLISGDEEGKIKIWDKRTQIVIETINAHDCRIKNITIDPSGERMISVSKDNVMKEWNIKIIGNSQLVAVYEKLNYNVKKVYFLEEDEIFFSTMEEPLTIRNLKGEIKQRLDLNDFCTNCAVISPDGRKLIRSIYKNVGDENCKENLIREYRKDNISNQWIPVRNYRSSDKQCISLNFNKDGTKFISSYKDNTIIEWSFGNESQFSNVNEQKLYVLKYATGVGQSIYGHSNKGAVIYFPSNISIVELTKEDEKEKYSISAEFLGSASSISKALFSISEKRILIYSRYSYSLKEYDMDLRCKKTIAIPSRLGLINKLNYAFTIDENGKINYNRIIATFNNDDSEWHEFSLDTGEYLGLLNLKTRLDTRVTVDHLHIRYTDNVILLTDKDNNEVKRYKVYEGLNINGCNFKNVCGTILQVIDILKDYGAVMEGRDYE